MISKEVGINLIRNFV